MRVACCETGALAWESPVDSTRPVWDNPTMSTAKVDTKKRIVLPNGRPGDVFEVQQQADGRFLLIRLEKPESPENMSREACLEAIRNAPLRSRLSCADLRLVTREP